MTSQPRVREMRLSATAKAAKDFGIGSAACWHTPTATASISSLKPSRWEWYLSFQAQRNETNILLGRVNVGEC
jgi:hypothetical protein